MKVGTLALVLSCLFIMIALSLTGLVQTNNHVDKLESSLAMVTSNLATKADAQAVKAAIAKKLDYKLADKTLYTHNIRLSVVELAASEKAGKRKWNKYVNTVATQMRERKQAADNARRSKLAHEKAEAKAAAAAAKAEKVDLAKPVKSEPNKEEAPDGK